MFERTYIKQLKKRVEEPRKFIQILTGPRQVGKTTLVEQLLKKISIPFHYVSADAISAFSGSWISQQWEAARISLKRNASEEGLIVIDEIQKIPNWSESVKREWDEDKRNGLNLKAILLGSSSLLIHKGLSESLAGRFEMINMPHWNYFEMKEAFGFEPLQYLWFGSYPGAVTLVNDPLRWRNYIHDSIIETTISKDILSIASVYKPALLKNLFELACTYSTQILSYTKIMGILNEKGNVVTLKHYQDLLDKIWFISGLSKYSTSQLVKRSSIPKWVVYDNAFASIYSGSSYSVLNDNLKLKGRLVESAVGAHLLNECRIRNWDLSYWRDNNYEVDFALRAGNKLISIEVKSGAAGKHEGSSVFARKFNPSKSLLISNDSIPWQIFLERELEEFI